MSSAPSPVSRGAAPESALLRAGRALPLCLLPVGFYLILQHIDSDSFWAPIYAHEITVGGRLFKIVDVFHGIPAVDEAFHAAMAVLSVSTLGWDELSWWQFYSFLMDVGSMYTVMLLESSRKSSAWTLAWLPLLAGLLYQTLGIGTVGGIYFFWLYVLSPMDKLLQPSSRSGDTRWSATVLPLILCFHTWPIYMSYNAASPATRHWYMWAWQLHPLYISIGQHLLAWLASLSTTSGSSTSTSTSTRHNDRTFLRLAILPTALISATIWLDKLLRSPFPLGDLLLPTYFHQPAVLPQHDFTELARHFLQADQLFGSGSALLWLLYSARDLRRAGLTGVGGARALVLVGGGVLVLGPGAVFALGWLWREEVLLDAAAAAAGRQAELALGSGKKVPSKKSKAFR